MAASGKLENPDYNILGPTASLVTEGCVCVHARVCACVTESVCMCVSVRPHSRPQESGEELSLIGEWGRMNQALWFIRTLGLPCLTWGCLGLVLPVRWGDISLLTFGMQLGDCFYLR